MAIENWFKNLLSGGKEPKYEVTMHPDIIDEYLGLIEDDGSLPKWEKMTVALKLLDEAARKRYGVQLGIGPISLEAIKKLIADKDLDVSLERMKKEIRKMKKI